MDLLKNMKIRHKLMALITGVCLCALLTAGVILLFFIRSATYELIVREIETDALLTAENCKVALASNDVEEVQRTLNSLRINSFVLYGSAFNNGDAEAFASFRRPDYLGPVAAPHGLTELTEVQQGVLTVSKTIFLDGNKLGTLCIGADLEPLREATHKAILAISSVIGVALLIGAFCAALTQGTISRRILALASLAEDVSTTNDYSRRVPVTSTDEIGLLASTFNRMLEQVFQRDTALVDTNDKLRLEVEERQKAEQKLELMNQELKSFAYVASHDLKAPLRGIKTLTDWLLDDYSEVLDDQGKEHLNLLSQRVLRMRNLINGILQYSRVGRIQEDFSEINLNEVVLEIIDTLAAPEHIKITLEKTLPTLTFEPTRMTQIFQNLLSNAIKYNDKPQGTIRVDCVEDDQSWTFSVSDNGPGINEAYFDRIFVIFQTLSARDQYESTGVGLAVVKKIIDTAGGRIWLTSTEGEGTTFFFTMPKQIQKTDNPEPDPATTETQALTA